MLDVLWDEHGLYSSCADGRVRELDDIQAKVDRDLGQRPDWVERLASLGGRLASQDAAGAVRQRRVTAEE